jgi:hypothetical protein
MGNYLIRVARAAARTSSPGTSAVGIPSRTEILYSPVGRAPESLSDGGLLLERERRPSLNLPENAVPEIASHWTEPSTAETAGALQANLEPDPSPILRVPAVGPESIVPRDPQGMPLLTEPSGATEQRHPAVDLGARGDSPRPDRPLPPASPPKPVISPSGPVQAASEIQPKDSEVVGDPGASPGIATKGIDSAATAEPVDRPRLHPGGSETREAIRPPQPGPAQPFRVQARQSNPSRVDASILRKSARKDAGAMKPIAPSPAVPGAVEPSPSGGNQGKANIQHTEVAPLHPTSAPPDRPGQEKADRPKLNTPAASEAALSRLGRGGQAIAPPPAADRPNSEKNGARIAIGRIEVQVNNHPQPVAAGRSSAQPAPREINLESRFIGRFVLRPA